MLNLRGRDEVQPFGDKVIELPGGYCGRRSRVGGKGSMSSEADAIHAVDAGEADLAKVPRGRGMP